MPTGYTAGVADGTVTEFRDFAWTVARGFGACVTMRDDPMDAPIPRAFKPDTRFYDDQIARGEKRLAELATMTLREADAAAAKSHREATERWTARRKERETQAARYRAMLAKVDAWNPPTPDHVEMKAFMRRQLDESIKFDCSGSYDKEPVRLSGAAWMKQARKEAEHDVEYGKRHRQEEIDRVAGRNAWLKALRESLK